MPTQTARIRMQRQRDAHRRIQLVDVTPTMAARWLEHNNCGNPLQPAKVAMFADLMAGGYWNRNPAGKTLYHTSMGAIGFRPDRKALVNGQHRLSAVVLAGITVALAVLVNTMPIEDADAISS